jgi:hypothetical protein
MKVRFSTAVLHISAGVIIWALHFLALYGLTALACARGLPQMIAPIAAAATLPAVVALAVVFWRGWARRANFEAWLSATTAAFALVAVLWEAAAVLLVPPCG